jgi:hypothetical protein
MLISTEHCILVFYDPRSLNGTFLSFSTYMRDVLTNSLELDVCSIRSRLDPISGREPSLPITIILIPFISIAFIIAS